MTLCIAISENSSERALSAAITIEFATGFPVTTAVEGGGVISLNPPGGLYLADTVVSATAVPATGWVFERWTGDVESTNQSIQLIMTGPKALRAHFRPRGSFELNLEIQGAGLVLVEPTGTTFAEGTVVTLRAIPNAGAEFIGWTRDANGTAQVIQIVMDRDRVVQAIFSDVTRYAITLSVTGQGQVEVDPPNGPYPKGTVVTLTPPAATGWSFVGWKGTLQSTTVPLHLVMDKTYDIETVFGEQVFTLQATTDGGGTVLVSPRRLLYALGERVVVEALPGGGGWTFEHWEGSVISNLSTLDLIVEGETQVEAVFSTVILVNTFGLGELHQEPSAQRYAYGERVLLTPVPHSGFYFVMWIGETSGDKVPGELIVTTDRPEIGAIFAELQSGQVTLTAIVEGPGAIAISPRKPVYASGEAVTLLAIPEGGAFFAGWLGSVESGANPVPLTLSESTLLTGRFLVAPVITALIDVPNEGQLTLSLAGKPGAVYVIERSEALSSWQPWLNVTNSTGTTRVIDTVATEQKSRFYRSTQAPP